jgi:hypothetical protein
MAKKIKYQCEFVVNSSPKILYNFISGPSGLAEWFCNDVNIRDGIYEFVWDGEGSQYAKLLHKKEGQGVRFKWEDDDDDEYYFEFAVIKDELTGDVSLMITDFSLPEDAENDKLIWESQVSDLGNSIGA